MNSRIVKQGFITSLPVMAGYVVLGIGFGILLRGAGYGVLWAFAMSALVYAGSMQYVGVGLPELAAAAGVIILQVWKRNSLVSILSGTVLYMVLVQLAVG